MVAAYESIQNAVAQLQTTGSAGDRRDSPAVLY